MLGKETPREQLPVIMRELGELSKCVMYFDAYPDDRRLYSVELKAALADLLIQVLLLAEDYSFIFEDLLKLGEKKFIEKMNEIRRLREKYESR